MGEDAHDLAALFDQSQVVRDPGAGVAGVAGHDQVAAFAVQVHGRFVAVHEGAQVFARVAVFAAHRLAFGCRALGQRGLHATLFLLDAVEHGAQFLVHVVLLLVVGLVASGFGHVFVGLFALAGDDRVRIRGDAGDGHLEQIDLASMHLGDAVVGCHLAVVHGDEADAEPVVDAFAHELDGLARGLGAGEFRGDVQSVRLGVHAGDAADEFAVLAADFHAVARAEVGVRVEHLGVVAPQGVPGVERHGDAGQDAAVPVFRVPYLDAAHVERAPFHQSVVHCWFSFAGCGADANGASPRSARTSSTVIHWCSKALA